MDELAQIGELLAAQGYGPDRIVIDPSVVRGLGYYTGPVYEAELTFEITDEKGRPRQFGSVAGGGRYDDLVKRFTGQAVPATGVSIGVDRLLAALAARAGAAPAEAGPVVVTVMDRADMPAYQAMAAELRAAGLRAEVFLGGGAMGRQLKYADQRASPVAVIAGEDERARGVVQLKDLALGARLAAEIETHEDWARPAGADRGSARPPRRRGARDAGARGRLGRWSATGRTCPAPGWARASTGSAPRSRGSSRRSGRGRRRGSSRRRCSRPTCCSTSTARTSGRGPS